MERLIDIKSAKGSIEASRERFHVENISKKDIAIIGLAGRFGSADSVQEFWEGLKAGKDFIGQLPDERREDVESYLNALNSFGEKSTGFEYYEAAYLKRIDHFDCTMFNLSPKEADLTDPNQRLFMETALEAVEDAGYGGKKLTGSRTGVFVGYSNDFNEDYKRYCRMVSNSTDEVSSAAGNIKSIIGSRISYLLDLKGPSIMIDTACSSALVSIHMACQSIRSGECDMAVAGGVKVILVPLREKTGQASIGIESSNARARTFDDSSDGTGAGEGVGAVILKQLSKAIKDGDNIYAVIKGSAVNQDGSSVGITAPNMAAQEDVILRAWKDANIDPETITYIETHGTGTKLGDPVEITGIQRAFENYTDKKQFCAVASVKTNIGHFDNAAGIVSLTKAVMALKNGELPPSLHFNKPNRRIYFENSPVYVNDRLNKWKSGKSPRRCGISSFGLSGTNCHLILEEYRCEENKKTLEKENILKSQVITLSAKNKDSLSMLVGRYQEFLSKCSDEEIENICYTANTGRGHYNLRLALVIENFEDLKNKINSIYINGLEEILSEGVFFNEHKIVDTKKESKYKGEITEPERKQLSIKANDLIERCIFKPDIKGYKKSLEQLCRLYTDGADIDWERLYQLSKHRKVNLPVYPYLKKRHWIKTKKEPLNLTFNIPQRMGHPLVHQCLVQSMGIEIYSTKFSVRKDWVLSEHKVAGNYVVPGTAYIEMIREIISGKGKGAFIEMKEVMFLAPLIVEETMEVEAQTIVKDGGNYKEFTIVSKSVIGDRWVKHVEGKILIKAENKIIQKDIRQLKSHFLNEEDYVYKEDIPGGVETGPRFKNLKKLYLGSEEVLAFLELPEAFYSDTKEYSLHPALLDISVNMANNSFGEGLYLPLTYNNLKVYGKMPPKIFSHLIKKAREKDNLETGVFDVTVMDEKGNVIAEASNYTVKRVHQEEIKSFNMELKNLGFYGSTWLEQPVAVRNTGLKDGAVLVIKDPFGKSDSIIKGLKERGKDVYEVKIGNCFEKINGNSLVVSNAEEDYRKLISEISDKNLSYVIHLASICGNQEVKNIEDLETANGRGLDSVFYLTKALVSSNKTNLDLIFLSDYADKISMEEQKINPHNFAMLGLGKVVTKEYTGLRCRCADIDESITLDDIIGELNEKNMQFTIAYRNGKRYVQEFKRLDVKAEEESIHKLDIKSEGVYIITGGTGGIGLEIAKFISSKKCVNLCLINRSAMPERGLWESLLKRNENNKLCGKIKSIMEIEENGSQVVCYSADVSDFNKMEQILINLRQDYGKLNAVIHAAGVAGDGFIFKKDKEIFSKVIKPKIHGTWILDKLTENDHLDFFVMFSSINSLIAVPGQGDYTAANAYLDSFAEYRNMKGKRTITINWPAWKETGMAVDYGIVNQENVFCPISTKAACRAFEKLIGCSVTRAIPAELNFDLLSNQDIELPLLLSEDIKQMIQKNSNQHKKEKSQEIKNIDSIDVILKGKAALDYSQIEKYLAQIWAFVLGIEEVDVFDNFNDLGGDSILATQLLKEIQIKFPGQVDISDVFTYSTINDMANYIDKRMNKKKEFEKIIEEDEDTGDEFDDVLKQLASGSLSVEEAKKLIDLEDFD